MLRRFILSFLLLLPFSSFAATGISYSFAELNYVSEDLEVDVDGPFSGSADDDGDGFNFNASFAIDETFFVNGGYTDVGLDDFDADLSTLDLGFGFRNSLSDVLDAYGVLSYEKFELEDSSGDDTDEDGFGVAGGLRGLLAPELELNGQVKYTDVGDFDGFGFKVGALYSFVPNWAVNADFSTRELEGSEDGLDVTLDTDELRIGLRYIFN